MAASQTLSPINGVEDGFVVDPEQIIVPVSTFFNTFEDLQHKAGKTGIRFAPSSAVFSTLMPNPLRKKSGGRMVYTVPLIIFMDDVSGNISKQWNKHHVVYISNGLLPRQMLEQEFSIRFVSGSPHTTPMELMRGVKDSIQKTADDPIIAFDIKDQEEVALILYGLIIASDNPMQAEECSHGGLKCNYFCRTCKVGGTAAEKKTDKGYTDLFQCGELRSPEDTRAEVKRQIQLSKLSGGTEKVKTALSQTGIRDNAVATIIERLLELGKNLRKRAAGRPVLSEVEVTARLDHELEALLGGQSLDDRINPLLGMRGLDIHRDTPTEILHTILLGVVKYLWGQTAYILDKGHSLEVFQMRMESINKDGLNSPTLNASYITRYKGSLIGKHFKSLAQVMPYLVYDLVPEAVLRSWSVIGKLVVLLWHTSFEDVELYLARLSCVIDDFLTISAQCAPSILVTKAKFHFLTHLPMFIRRFGPAILFSTERYESFNHVFRLSSIYSNRQAPSRDACRLFAEQGNVRHAVTGGVWRDPATGKWVRAGPAIVKYIDEHPEQRCLLGFPKSGSHEVGAVHLPRCKNGTVNTTITPLVDWRRTEAAKHTGLTASVVQPKDQFYQAKSFMAAHGDRPSVGSHVIIKSGDVCQIGTVLEILVQSKQRIASHVLVTLLEFSPELHTILHVPRVRYPTQERKTVVSARDVLCMVNIQHDCITASCTSRRTVPRKQERLITSQTKNIIDHNPDNAYILNTYSIHNYQWIQAAVPRSIYDEIHRPLFSDHLPPRTHAAELLRSKKGENTNDGLASANPPISAYTNKAKGKGKGKGKGKEKEKEKEKAIMPPAQPAMAPVINQFNHHTFSSSLAAVNPGTASQNPVGTGHAIAHVPSSYANAPMSIVPHNPCVRPIPGPSSFPLAGASIRHGAAHASVPPMFHDPPQRATHSSGTSFHYRFVPYNYNVHPSYPANGFTDQT